MPLHSLWNNSRSLHDYRALPRVREGVVLSCACAQLKLPVSNIERPTLNAERPTSTAGGGARTHTALRPLDFESSASANSATPALLGNSSLRTETKIESQHPAQQNSYKEVTK